EPRGLTAVLAVEQTGDAGRAPAASGLRTTTDAAHLVAAQATDAVVAEQQIQHAVVLRATDVGPAGSGPELDDGHPPAAGREHRHPSEGELPDATTERGRRREQVHE